jgi:outer membrane protein
VREGKGGHYPSLSFNLGASQSDVGYDNTLTPRSDSYVATIGLKVPIYSGGSTSARVSGLYDEQYAAEQDLEGVRRQVVKETTNAYLTAQSAVDKIRAGQNALSSAKQSSIAAQKAFTYGVVNAVDVLTAVQNEFKARGDLLKSQYDFITNLFILNRWAGKLSQESVASVNVWLGGDDSEALKDLNNSGPK